MIELIGESGTSEYRVAKHIYDQILNAIPTIGTSLENIASVKIAANVKLSGYEISDIDIVVVGSFKEPWKFIPSFALAGSDGKAITHDRVNLKNFVLAVEVKDHDPSGIKVIGDKVNVRYSRGGVNQWKSASDQNIKQLHTISRYLKSVTKDDVYSYRTLVLTGLNESPVKGALPADFTFKQLVTHMLSTGTVRKTSSNGYYVSSTANGDKLLKAPIFYQITPTGLDRKRMDAILSASTVLGEAEKHIGNKFFHIRGHGGTGKTLLLLAIARKLILEKDYKILILTYNHALAADISRLVSFIDTNSNSISENIQIHTAVGFLSNWIRSLGLKTSKSVQYDELCSECLDMFDERVITDADIENQKSINYQDLDFDLVLVDEAQDWPQQEIDFLQNLYPVKQMIIANGLEQMLRTQSKADWHKKIPKENRELLFLDTSLRMKLNLGVFANSFAEISNLDWSFNVNLQAGGGKVYFVKKGNPKLRSLHNELLLKAKDMGNKEIDILHCVPSSYIKTDANNEKYSLMARALIKDGVKVWDAVNDSIRRDIPRDSGMERVVHYNSCRGLEGWVVVLHSLDEYFEEKFKTLNIEGTTDVTSRRLLALMTMMIPLTRPIDSLIITYNDENSFLVSKFKEVQVKHRDFIELVS